MVHSNSRHYLHEVWWMLMLRGIALVLFGILAVVWPGITLFVLALSFAIMLLVLGVADIIQGLGAVTKQRLWFLTIVAGVVELAVAVYALRGPALTLRTFIVLAGLILIFKGIFEVVAAFEEAHDPGLRLLMLMVGALAVVAGIIVVRYPATSLNFVWALGVYGVVAGPLNIAAAISLRADAERLEHTTV